MILLLIKAFSVKFWKSVASYFTEKTKTKRELPEVPLVIHPLLAAVWLPSLTLY